MLHGFGTSIADQASLGFYKDAPLTYVNADSQGEEIGTINDIPMLLSAGAWAAVVTRGVYFERAADGTWTKSNPLLDALPSAWLPAFGLLLFDHNADAALMLRRVGDAWEGPFLTHPRLLARDLVSLPNGDVAMTFRQYDPERGPTAPMSTFVQRRVNGSWYAPQLLGDSDDVRAAVSSAGDLVVVRTLSDAITVHATGPNFR